MSIIVLTGPAAAAHLLLDGFKDLPWPELWCVPRSGRSGPQTLRVRHWADPVVYGDLVIANPVLVLRHLGEFECQLGEQPDGLGAEDRIEFAVEHALRDGLVTLQQLRKAVRGGRTRGDRLLRIVLERRGDEPAAESFAEVQAIQWLRAWGFLVWRQIPVYEGGRLKHRVDLVIAFDDRAVRPAFAYPGCGLLVEIDSKQFHQQKFEADHDRQITYDALGLEWMSATPNQFSKNPARVRQAIEQRLASARRSQTRSLRALPAKQAGKAAA